MIYEIDKNGYEGRILDGKKIVAKIYACKDGLKIEVDGKVIKNN